MEDGGNPEDVWTGEVESGRECVGCIMVDAGGSSGTMGGCGCAMGGIWEATGGSRGVIGGIRGVMGGCRGVT